MAPPKQRRHPDSRRGARPMPKPPQHLGRTLTSCPGPGRGPSRRSPNAWGGRDPDPLCHQNGHRATGFRAYGHRWPPRTLALLEKSFQIKVLCGMTETRTRTPFRAADFRTTTAFATAARRLWSGLCLDRMTESRRPRPSSLYTFRDPSGSRLGSASSGSEFAEFERIPQVVSGPAAQSFQVCCVYR